MKIQVLDLTKASEEEKQLLADLAYANMVGEAICPHCGKGFDVAAKDGVWSHLKKPVHAVCFEQYEKD